MEISDTFRNDRAGTPVGDVPGGLSVVLAAGLASADDAVPGVFKFPDAFLAGLLVDEAAAQEGLDVINAGPGRR
ncbi:hypothetical protein [Streptomyces sp. bgisy126]|uniref:hypothetical protein n=1 Tax=unclassified Streptomyces TaxID=2593676 RepID=UPI003EBD4D98